MQKHATAGDMSLATAEMCRPRVTQQHVVLARSCLLCALLCEHLEALGIHQQLFARQPLCCMTFTLHYTMIHSRMTIMFLSCCHAISILPTSLSAVPRTRSLLHTPIIPFTSHLQHNPAHCNSNQQVCSQTSASIDLRMYLHAQKQLFHCY